MRHTLNIFLGEEAETLASGVSDCFTRSATSAADGFFSTMVFKDSNDTAARQAEYLRDYRSRTITINNPGDYPHLLITACLFAGDNKAMRLLATLQDAIKPHMSLFDLDVVLLSDEIRHLTFGKKATASNESMRLAAQQLADKGVTRHIVAIDNTNCRGLSLNIDKDTLIRLLCTYSKLCVEQYASVYNQADDTDTEHPVAALGLSVLEFDRQLFTDYLLTRTYLHAMHKEGVDQDEIDINTVSVETDKLLKRYVNHVDDYWRSTVLPRIIEGRKNEDVVAQAGEQMSDAFNRLDKDIQSMLTDPNTSLPHKQAMMAMLLGEDDKLLTGYLYNHEQNYIEDIDTEALSLFLDEDEHLATKELREQKNQMRETAAFLREKTAELEAVEKQIADVENSQKRLTDDGFTFGDVTYKLSHTHDEVPLADTYSAHAVKQKSVDLRKQFTAIRNQGEQGSCTAHTGIAIFEYLIKKDSGKTSDLSEAFVYYNTRRRTGDENDDTGATIFDLLKALQDYGVCKEELCRYNASTLRVEKPSEAAYSDALLRRVTEAKNVRLRIDDFKSALSDGLPIIISMKMYDSFDAPRGFVTHPRKGEVPGYSGNHAMVVCGYNDEKRVFIVRNSWGTKFGDKGYCYMPYSFVEGEDIVSMGAVITGTTMGDVNVKADIDTADTITFDGIDANIRHTMLQNTVYDERRKLGILAQQYNNLRTEHDTLILKLGNNSERRERISRKMEQLREDISDIDQQIEQIRAQRATELDSIRSAMWTVGIRSAILALPSIIVLIQLLWPEHWTTANLDIFYKSIAIVAVAALATTGLWYYWEHKKKIVRAKYADMISVKTERRLEMERELNRLPVKAQIYGMAIDSSAQLQLRLKSVYRNIYSFVGNLKTWMGEERKRQEEHTAAKSRDPFIQAIDTNALDTYFDTQCQPLTADIHLYEHLADYKIDDNGIADFKKQLKDSVAKYLDSVCDNFSMLRYVLGLEAYPYMPSHEGGIDALMARLNAKGQIFLPVADDTDYTPTGHTIFVKAGTQGERTQWINDSGHHFEMPPLQCDHSDSASLVLLQMRRISPRDIK